jgi:hypothetical protein
VLPLMPESALIRARFAASSVLANCAASLCKIVLQRS